MKKHYLNSRKYSTLKNSLIILLYIFLLFACSSENEKKGWYTYRHDGFRSAITDEDLPENLSPKWVFKPTNSPVAAWYKPGEELPRMHVDNTYNVVSAKGLVYFGSSVDNKLYALNSSTGAEEWTFFAEGPIRFAPSIWKDHIYFGSDDGYVYCLDARNGDLEWKYRAGPSDKKVLGNGNMISLWPIRTSVLVEEGVVYLSAGVFPYEGLYICALDSEDGKIIWKNDTIGDKAHEIQFGGISPFGYILASEDHLYIPSGRSMPAVFDKKNGKFLYALSPGSKAGGTWALINEGNLIAGVDRSGTPTKIMYDLESGQRKGDAFVSFNGIDMVARENISYVVTSSGVHAINRAKYPQIENTIDSLLTEIKKTNSSIREIAQTNLEKKKSYNNNFDQLIEKNKLLKQQIDSIKKSATKWQYKESALNTIVLAKNKVIAGGKGVVIILDSESGKELTRFKIDGRALGLAVTEGHLFANNEKGYIYCFDGSEKSLMNEIKTEIVQSPYENAERSELYKRAAKQIIAETGVQKGYCLVLNSANGQLAYELAKQSELKIIGISPSEDNVKKAREKLANTGLYGARITIENWAAESLPDYFANLIVSDDFLFTAEIKSDAKEIYRVLKPLGGTVFIGQSKKSNLFDKTALVEWMQEIGAEKPEVIDSKGLWVKTKRGALEGAGSWTHQYADPTNSICSDDTLVNYPFGVLWYGEPGPEKMVERHARAASPLAKNGRLFIQGENVVMAYDSYNGIKLWEREIQGATRVRADVDGSNLALSDDGLFVAIGEKCLLLDAATGKTLNTYKIPNSKNGKKGRWGFIACSGNMLYGSVAKPFNNEYNHLLPIVTSANKDDQENSGGIPSYFDSQCSFEDAADFELQRSGAKWHFIADYPAWDGGIVTQEPATERTIYSDVVFAMDIKSGKTKWVHRGKEIAHITISIGDENIYFADKAVTSAEKRQGIKDRKKLTKTGIWKSYTQPVKDKDTDVRLVTVLDKKSGKVKWENPIDLTGCGGDAVASAYKNDILLFFGSFGLHDKWRFSADELRWHRITALSSDNGKMIWSRPLNYMVRPVIVNNTIIVEPRSCDLLTGEIKTRTHPITGKTVPWEYFRPGHTCAITSATQSCLFYRSYNAAFYDMKGDRGITYFGAVRPGCWINMIPANGLLLFPEASAGCTCSFPLRTTLVLKPVKKTEAGDWSVFVSQGPITPVKRLGINLGAPGDKKDENGNIWFGYPRPITSYGVRFNLNETVNKNMGYFAYDTRGVKIKGTEKPWLYTSGCVGLSKCKIKLLDETWTAKPGSYTVRLGFYIPSGDRIFDIKIQGNSVLDDFDPREEMDDNREVVIKEFNHVKVESDLVIELVPDNQNPKFDEAPIINSIEIIREDLDDAIYTKTYSLSQDEIGQNLKSADIKRANGNIEESLTLYHKVFKSAEAMSIKERALNGMAAIGSSKSLNLIENCVNYSDPIFWDYNKANSKFVDHALRVYVNIANNLFTTNPRKTKIMLANAATKASDVKFQEKIIANMSDLGIDFVSEAESVNNEQIIKGIQYNYFPGIFTAVSALDAAKPKESGVMNGFNLEEPEGVTEYGYTFSGYLFVPYASSYTFFLESNDGSKLYISGKEVINNDGGHGVKEELGKINLSKGYYPILVKYFQAGGGQKLKVSWQRAGSSKEEITDNNLFYDPDKN